MPREIQTFQAVNPSVNEEGLQVRRSRRRAPEVVQHLGNEAGFTALGTVGGLGVGSGLGAAVNSWQALKQTPASGNRH